MDEILFAEDDSFLRRAIAERLEGAMYSVVRARNGEEALAKYAAHRPNLLLLDIEMPKKSGFEVCREIRRTDALTPIIFLTANDSEANEVKSMGLGADDFIAKFAGGSKEEWCNILFARIARALDRASAYDRPSESVKLGKMTVDFNSQTVIDEGKEIALSNAECEALKVLFDNRGHVVKAEQLATADAEGVIDDSAVYTMMWRLRNKLGAAGNLIVSVRGHGYRLLK